MQRKKKKKDEEEGKRKNNTYLQQRYKNLSAMGTQRKKQLREIKLMSSGN